MEGRCDAVALQFGEESLGDAAAEGTIAKPPFTLVQWRLAET